MELEGKKHYLYVLFSFPGHKWIGCTLCLPFTAGLREPQQPTELLGQLMALLQVDEMLAFALNVKGSDPAGG